MMMRENDHGYYFYVPQYPPGATGTTSFGYWMFVAKT